MQGKIDDVTESIQMCTNNIIDFQNEIRQIKWDNFDYLHETISQISDESDFLIDLFSNKDLFDDKGNITNYGTSTLGLRGMNYNVYMQQSQSYAREIERLNEEIAKTPNDKELIARRNELIKSQQEMILSAKRLTFIYLMLFLSIGLLISCMKYLVLSASFNIICKS